MFMFKINQADLLRRAIRPFADMGARANINYSPDFLMLQTANSDVSVTVLLLIKSGSFEFFLCNQERGCIGINPRILDNILNAHAGAEWSLSIHADADERFMRFFFKDNSQGIRRGHRINLLDGAPYGRLDIMQLGFIFKAVVGIRSDYFQNDLILLSGGFGRMVNVYITHDQLKFSTVDKEIVLTKEIGQCIIGGVAEHDQPIEFSFSLEHMAAYQNASLMSRIVWILTPDLPGGPFMLNCPVGLLGNIMFLFPPNI